MAANRALASSSQSALSDRKPPSESLFISDGSEGSPTPNLPRNSGDQDDQKFKRLFFIYDRARKDFEATPAKTLERTKSAKFLRDTTENCLAYIAAKQSQPGAEVTCDGLLHELKSTLEETIAIAEQGSGGKKRRFDENWENVPQEPAKMRGPVPSAVRTFPNESFLLDSISRATCHGVDHICRSHAPSPQQTYLRSPKQSHHSGAMPCHGYEISALKPRLSSHPFTPKQQY